MTSDAAQDHTFAATKFTAERPDSDGSMGTEAVFRIRNPALEPIRLFTMNTAVLSKRGFLLACRNDDMEDCSIDPGESMDHRLWLGSASGVASEDRPDNLTLLASITLCSREFFKIGEVDVPSADLGTAGIEKVISSEAIDGPVRVLVIRDKPDDEGKASIMFRLSVQNRSALHLPRVVVKAVLLDAEDSITEESNVDGEVLAGGIRCFEGSSAGFLKSHYRGAKLRFTLTVFRPVHTATCSATSMASDS